MAKIANTDLNIFPLNLGGNVFGWTADEDQSFAVLDAYASAGGNFIDTADVYSAWVEGNTGGESEAIIGKWMKQRGNRDQMVIATKVGSDGGLGAKNIQKRVEESLSRLQTDYIDLYYSHKDDPSTPVEETLAAFNELVEAGKVRHLAASNFTTERLTQSLEASRQNGWAAYVGLQPHYNLVERDLYEGELAAVCERENLSVFPYYSLASGFLTGKYRVNDKVDSPRAGSAAAYLNQPNGPSSLEALNDVANTHQTTVAAVALAWLLAQPTISAPIASARTVAQLEGLLPMAELQLTDDELKVISLASE